MGYFPLCVDLRGRTVLVIGSGPKTREKIEKLQRFGCSLRRVAQLCPQDLTAEVAAVVVGDMPHEEAEQISALCGDHRIPVNVVDEPALCSFFFPAVITRGALTVSVSTEGKAPGAAGYLAREIAAEIPDRTEEILDWLQTQRRALYGRLPQEQARAVLGQITRRAFESGKPLMDREVDGVISMTAPDGQVIGKI